MPEQITKLVFDLLKKHKVAVVEGQAKLAGPGKLEVAKGYVTNAITDDALEFIDAPATADSPFFFSVHYTAPHSPWTGHPQDIVELVEHFQSEDIDAQ